MENEEKINEAARKYAESLLGSEQFKNPQNKDFIEACVWDFTTGAEWASRQETMSQAQIDETAWKYANKVVGQPKKHQDAVEGVAHDFVEGVLWYIKEYRSQQKNAFPCHKILNFFLHTFIGRVLGFILLWCAFGGLIIVIDRLAR